MTRDQFDEYADMLRNPVTAQSIELGNRVLHWTFVENWSTASGRGVIVQHARNAQEQAAGR